jgi:ABC-type polysaccharide/polyol phosphate transport system ATPase subunit
MPPIIEVDHVTKEFILGEPPSLKRTALHALRRLAGRPVEERPPFKALDDVHFAVQPGEVLGIIGHNGAGKSTLLKILAGISAPTRGRVAVRGRVAPLIEVGAGLLPDLTGRENVFLNAIILGMKREEVKRRFDEIVDFAELAEFIDTPVKRYSSGMRVRLGFAIATSVSAEILIVDEVLAVGDLAFQRKCFDRMEALIKRDGRTVLLVSHNIRQVERLCRRVLLLDHGRLVEDGDPRDVCNAYYEASDEHIQQAIARRPNSRFATSGDIDLEGVRLLDVQGREVAAIEYLMDAIFSVTYRVKRPIPEPVFSIGIHTTDLLYLANNQSLEHLSPGPLDPGTYRVDLVVRRFPFLPGVYSLRLGVAAAGSFQALFYCENVIPVRVASTSLNRAVVSRKNEGFVGLEGEWRFHAHQTQRRKEVVEATFRQVSGE